MKKSSGFTLLEVLIAMSILATALILLANSWGASANRLRKIDLQNEVAHLLERKVAEIEMEYKGQPISNVKEEDSGEFEEPYSNYTWEMASQEIVFPDIAAMMKTENNEMDPNVVSMIETLKNTIEKNILEVKVSVVANIRGKKLKYSVVTYFVDFENAKLESPGG